MATIEFTDSTGAALLTNGYFAEADGVATRFRGWRPFTRPIGPLETALGTGRSYRFVFRTDYGAAFAVAEIPNSSLDIALRLMAHLLNGGTIAVATEDIASRLYSTCGLAPGTEPALEGPDPVTLRYTLSLTVINLATPGAPMLCIYD